MCLLLHPEVGWRDPSLNVVGKDGEACNCKRPPALSGGTEDILRKLKTQSEKLKTLEARFAGFFCNEKKQKFLALRCGFAFLALRF